MSGINRFLSRREKHKSSGHQEKVMSKPMPSKPPTPDSSSTSSYAFSGGSTPFHPFPKHSSSSSLSSLSLAFPNLPAKRSPRLQATDGIVHSSTANTFDHCLLQPRQTSGHLYGLFSNHEEGIPEKDEDKKIKALTRQLASIGITHFNESDIEHVLKATYVKGDTRKAYDLLVLLEDSEEGVLRPFNPKIKLLGAINRHGISCYLDSVLFAMFARLESFEAILYKNFDDEPRKRLATFLRLWVNTLRVGKLITMDLTKQLQESLADCGWKEAAEKHQQDASEAFSFITEKLELPLLTLKMDIFHTGKEDASDDHKLVHERLLNVAIPEAPADGSEITLEECLENYFNSRIEVKRYLERRATLNSTRSRNSIDPAKGQILNVESVEVNNSQPSSPTSAVPQSPLPQYPSARPLTGRPRAPSIIQEHYVNEKAELAEYYAKQDARGSPNGLRRTGSIRKEVLMPAWQFFSLIPWYTDNVPSSDAQVAAHFTKQRPVLGICLKRYSVSINGQAQRRSTHVDIPLEIGLPHFIQDNTMCDDGVGFGNFKLSLQSVVCHRGDRVDSGHYVSLVRGQASNAKNVEDATQNSASKMWMLFDDMAKDRVTYVDIERALREESPYLLFYQVQPIEGDPGSIEDGENLPSYMSDGVDSGIAGVLSSNSESKGSTGDSLEIGMTSLDTQISDEPRGRSSMTSDRRMSVAFTDTSTGNARGDRPGEATTDGTKTSTISLGLSRRGSKSSKKGSKSRAQSLSGDKTLSVSFTRLAGMLTKDKSVAPPDLAIPEVPQELTTTTASQTDLTQEIEKAKLKVESKDKKSHRLSEHHHLLKGKKKSEKLDRECNIM